MKASGTIFLRSSKSGKVCKKYNNGYTFINTSFLSHLSTAITELRHGRGRTESYMSSHSISSDLSGSRIQATRMGQHRNLFFPLSPGRKGTGDDSTGAEVLFWKLFALQKLWFICIFMPILKNQMKSLGLGQLRQPLVGACILPATPRAPL